ncbi:MAG TPA: HAD-IIIA family hydrolase [Gemmatimonadaceae bacterium]|jgi:histidinol-phosphate phosphatase family protein|nr:HAD-IIIA family hydrolase [Gemmatimonadaceae bacterium]
MSGSRRFAFLDKDGTLVDDVPYNVDPTRIALARGADALCGLRDAGFRFAVISNQPGVALGLFPEHALVAVERRLRALLGELGVSLEDFLYCPHHPEGVRAEYSRACDCRKPAPGLLYKARDGLGADLRGSWMIGDTLDDVEAAHRAGCRAAFVDNGGETEWVALFSPLRRPDVVATDLGEAVRLILAHHE